MFSKGSDPLFVIAPEWVSHGETSSKHSSEKLYDLPKTYILFSYPRAFTPVCNEELKRLHKAFSEYDITVPVIAASGDSPEAQQQFYYSEEYFEKQWYHHPSLTLRKNYLTDRGNHILLDDFGYSYRATVAVKDNKIVYYHREFVDEARSIGELVRVVTKLKEG